MNPKSLFLHRVSQLKGLVESTDEIDLVDIAGILRQLLFDRHALADIVSNGQKITFDVGIFRPGWGPNEDPHWEKVTYVALQDGIDPESSVSGLRTTVTLGQFGQHVIAYSNGETITVKDMIKYNANKRGGRHWDPRPDTDYKKLAVLETLYIGGNSAARRELKAIGRVVLRALDPLARALKSTAS